MENTEIITFKAIILHKRYYNEDSCWGTYNFCTKDDIPHYINYTASDCIPKQYDKTSSLVGKMQNLSVGAEYLIKATYQFNKTYGHQYNPISVYALEPQSKEMQELFLKSIVTESQAKSLITAYPNIVNDVIYNKIDNIDYSLTKGIRETTWLKIKDKIINNYLISDILVMLKPLGITYVMIKKLLSEQSNPTLLKKQIEENPYTLTKIKGLGFKKVDSLALKLKPELVDSKERLVAFIVWFFQELGEKYGDTWVDIEELKNNISNNVFECLGQLEWVLNNNTFLYIEDNKVGLKLYKDIEYKTLELLTKKAKSQPVITFSTEEVEKAIKQAETEQGFEYTAEQKQVIQNTLNSSLSVITGKAGTGKSSIMRAILTAYANKKAVISSSALSAMAAQRISEATTFPAATIHRTLGYQGLNKFIHNKDYPIIADLVLMDEASMVNASLFLKWVESISKNSNVVISGDNKQLPPIGFGNIFSDIIQQLPKKSVNKLTKPMRQATKSGILTDANTIRNNKNPISKPMPKIVTGELQDMYYIFKNSRENLFKSAVNTYLSSIETDGIDNVVIAVPRKQGCTNSTMEINKYIQNKLLGNEQKEISSPILTFKLGAKVMQTVNDYENNVFNGETGYITEIGEDNSEKKKDKYCIVTFYDVTDNSKKEVKYRIKDMINLDLAYAMTVHKLQGAGKKTVIGIIDNTHYQLLDSCMLYTMLTRAKKRCLLLAEPDAFLKCVRTNHNKRNTWLNLG